MDRTGRRDHPGWVRRFVDRFGWRAYALPVLIVVTAAAVAQMSISTPASSTTGAGAPLPTTTAPGRSAHSTGPTAPSSSPVASPATGPSTSAPAPASIVSISGMPDSTVCLSNSHATFVLVSISQQHAWMCQGHVQVNSTPVTTGETLNDDATPTGSWIVQGKQTDRYLVGPGYRDYVKYWIPFNGDFGFHDASWQTFPYGSPLYRSEGSHGCVHLPLAEVSWLYQWAQTGSTVVTIEA